MPPRFVIGRHKSNGIEPGPHPHRDAIAGHGHPDDDLGQIASVVFAVAVRTETLVCQRIRVSLGRLGAGRDGAGETGHGPPVRRVHPARSR